MHVNIVKKTISLSLSFCEPKLWIFLFNYFTVTKAHYLTLTRREGVISRVQLCLHVIQQAIEMYENARVTFLFCLFVDAKLYFQMPLKSNKAAIKLEVK